MFDKHCDFALNRLDKDAIVCQSVTGEHIRLTQEDFASEEEFNHWKAWSDDDYHKIQLAGRNDDDCLSFRRGRTACPCHGRGGQKTQERVSQKAPA